MTDLYHKDELDKHRKIITVYSGMDIPFDDEFTPETFLKHLVKEIARIEKDMHGAKVVSFRFWEETWYENSSYGINVKMERPETDQEIRNRLKKEEAKQNKAEKRKAAAKAKKEKDAKAELELYERLKQKYESA